MGSRLVDDRGAERGAAAIATVVAAAFALVLFVGLANLVTVRFTRNAVRAALDEGVRAGNRSDAPVAECEARAGAVLEGLLAPAARRAVTIGCAVGGTPEVVRARATVELVPWWPGLPVWAFTLESAAVREALP